METTTIDELAEIREQLKEARRYVRRDAAYAAKSLVTIAGRIGRWIGYNEIGHAGKAAMLSRLDQNLCIGLEYIQVNPDVTIGYIDGAVFELSLKGE